MPTSLRGSRACGAVPRRAARGYRPLMRRASIVAISLVAIVGSACRSLPEPPRGARHVKIATPDGESLDAVELGDGSRVAVMSHGATGTKEGFYRLAPAFADAGWRVIAYDARGVGDSSGTRGDARDADLRAVVDHARATGATSIVLIGASQGAALSLSMAKDLDADAVVSLSAPADEFGAIDAARSLTVPVFVAAAQDNQPYADDARRLADVLGIEPTIVSGGNHGTGMFADHPELATAIVRFADRAVPPSGGQASTAA